MALTYFGHETHDADDGGATALEFRTLFTCPQSGEVGEVSARLFAGSGAPLVCLAIYDSTGTTKICEGTAAVTVTGASPGSWQGHLTQASLTPNPVSLVSGVQYLVVMSGAGGGGAVLALRYDSASSSPDSAYTLNDYSGGYPASLPGGSTGSGFTYAIRVGIVDGTGGGGSSDAGMGGHLKKNPIRPRAFAPGVAR